MRSANLLYINRRIALKAMEAAFAGGIGSVAHLRWTPHIIYNIDLLRQKRASLAD